MAVAELPIQDLIDCAVREIRQRQHVYPRLVAQRKMTREKMNHEIRCMEQIERILRLEGKKEQLL